MFASRFPTNNLLFNTSKILALFGALALTAETYLGLKGTSLCQTSACEIVGNYLIISEELLIAAGAILFWLLTALLFFSTRYPQQIGNIPGLILAVAMAIDGTLIGFQFFTIQQKCFLCIATAVTLFLTSLFYCKAKKMITMLLIIIFVWFGGFIAQSIIDMPDPKSAYSQIPFYQRIIKTRTSNPIVSNTLIFSMECPHCLEVISELAAQNPKTETWRLATIDLGACPRIEK